MHRPSFFITGNPTELEAYVFDGTEVHLSEEEWKAALGPEGYRVLRQKGTEQAFAGSLYGNHDAGLYQCGACGLPLFRSDEKYESGSGWPSFFRPITRPAEPPRIRELRDTSHGMVRIEIQCARCHSHLGHVFPDGPAPTGLRYCVNSASLHFDRAKR